MMEWVAVFIGGGIGSLSRLGMNKWLGGAELGFPWATFLTNIAACLVLGVVTGFVTQRGHLHPTLRLGLTAGFCGGFSTFSTFSLESMKLWEGGKFILMGMYVLASVGLCFFGIWVGQWMGRQMS